MEHARLISIAQKVIHKFGKDRQLTLCCAAPGQSAQSIRGRELNKEHGIQLQMLNMPSHLFN